MQRKLSAWAEQDKERKFYDLYKLLHDDNWLRLAHDYVKQNAGSRTAGCDGINMSFFDEALDKRLFELGEELKSETFQPCPVRRVTIPKPNGKVRPLGIPSIKDRIVQEALRMALEPIYEADFSQYSFGFRPNRCTMDAIKCILWSATEHKKFFWVVEGDISSYFDTINHRRLVKILRRRIGDEKIIRLIWKFLRAGVMEGKLFRDTKLGTPQGGIVSPLLANVYLHELDKYIEKYTGLSLYEKRLRRQRGLSNFVYVRYADDFVVLCNGAKSEAEELKEELYNFLKGKLRLNLSKEKTKVTHLSDGFKFLGFWIQRKMGSKGMGTKVLIPEEAVTKMTSKLATITAPHTHLDSVATKFLALNRVIGGWCRYYQYTSKADRQFHKIDYETFWMVAHWLGRKFRLPMPGVMRRFRRGNSFAAGGIKLTLPHEFSSLTYKKRFLKVNPYTHQEVIRRENLPEDYLWTGWEDRPGTTDLRPVVLHRDGYTCQVCDKPNLTLKTSEMDHIKPVRRFKRPVDANRLENLWTLCVECHQAKTKSDRQRESRMQ